MLIILSQFVFIFCLYALLGIFCYNLMEGKYNKKIVIGKVIIFVIYSYINVILSFKTCSYKIEYRFPEDEEDYVRWIIVK